jgi:hypothetical protein
VEAGCRCTLKSKPPKKAEARASPACFDEASRRVQRRPSGEKGRELLCLAGGIRTASPVGSVAIGLAGEAICGVRELPTQSRAVRWEAGVDEAREPAGGRRQSKVVSQGLQLKRQMQLQPPRPAARSHAEPIGTLCSGGLFVTQSPPTPCELW